MKDEASPVPQIKGCLPEGYGRDSILTLEQFGRWQQLNPRMVRAWLPSMKGVLRRSQRDINIHVGTFLDGARLN